MVSKENLVNILSKLKQIYYAIYDTAIVILLAIAVIGVIIFMNGFT